MILDHPVYTIPILAAIFEVPITSVASGESTSTPDSISPQRTDAMFNALPSAVTVQLTEEFKIPPNKVPSRPLINGTAPLRRRAAKLIAPAQAIRYRLNAS